MARLHHEDSTGKGELYDQTGKREVGSSDSSVERRHRYRT